MGSHNSVIINFKASGMLLAHTKIHKDRQTYMYDCDYTDVESLLMFFRGCFLFEMYSM
jgi:hypothetical protein